MIRKCKFCNIDTKNYNGFCQKCYTYFCVNQYKNFKYKVKYGVLSIVDDKNSSQFGMPICHICGNAYTKLQSHIAYAHHKTKPEYCEEFGLDKTIRMTTDAYSKKMHDYALQYNMDEQLRRVGKDTRFVKGNNNNYKRSYMTIERLKKYGKEMGYKNLKNQKEENK